MNQAPLIADFTLSGPIVGPYRRGSDSSGQTLRGEGGQEGVGSISSKKTCQQNKILTNDRKDLEIPPPFPVQTPSQPSLFGRWRHLLSRLTFVRYRLRKAECPPRSARASSCVCRSGSRQLLLHVVTHTPDAGCFPLSLDLPHTRPCRRRSQPHTATAPPCRRCFSARLPDRPDGEADAQERGLEEQRPKLRREKDNKKRKPDEQ